MFSTNLLGRRKLRTPRRYPAPLFCFNLLNGMSPAVSDEQRRVPSLSSGALWPREIVESEKRFTHSVLCEIAQSGSRVVFGLGREFFEGMPWRWDVLQVTRPEYWEADVDDIICSLLRMKASGEEFDGDLTVVTRDLDKERDKMRIHYLIIQETLIVAAPHPQTCRHKHAARTNDPHKLDLMLRFARDVMYDKFATGLDRPTWPCVRSAAYNMNEFGSRLSRTIRLKRYQEKHGFLFPRHALPYDLLPHDVYEDPTGGTTNITKGDIIGQRHWDMTSRPRKRDDEYQGREKSDGGSGDSLWDREEGVVVHGDSAFWSISARRGVCQDEPPWSSFARRVE